MPASLPSPTPPPGSRPAPKRSPPATTPFPLRASGTAWRRQGIGTALLGALESHARELGATCFETRFRDDHPKSLAFAEHRGYAVDGHHFGSQLDLQAFDETPFAPVISRLESEGIRCLSLADPHTAALEQSLYELCKAASADEPGFENEPFPPFAAWREDSLSGPAGLVIVAADGDQAVAFSHISPSANGNMRTHFTCVHRDYRGRDLALAVKLLAIWAGRRHGGQWLKTGSDSRNVAMLSINKKLGYVYMPGMYRCFKQR